MRHAFSLVELSIVLVILGLLVGGVLSGQSLIRASEMRTVTTEYANFTGAIYSFRDKYFSLPGDMPNATKFWGVAASCPGDYSTPSTDGKTCDGDGDGLISTLASNNTNESERSWQHLANAGLIEGHYDGVAESPNGNPGPDYSSAYPGKNVPRSKLGNGGWQLRYEPDHNQDAIGSGNEISIADTTYFDGAYGTTLIVGSVACCDPGNGTHWPLLKPEEAWNIDTKMDDGMPATGKVVTMELFGKADGTGCTNLAPSNTVSLAASKYSFSNASVACSLLMKIQQ